MQKMSKQIPKHVIFVKNITKKYFLKLESKKAFFK